MVRTTPVVERACPVCGVLYAARVASLKRNRDIYCSLKCSYIGRRFHRAASTMVDCKRCGKPFRVNTKNLARGRGKFCSRECQHPPLFLICANCGKAFRTSPSAKAKFCSKHCANTAPEKSATARKNALRQWQDPELSRSLREGIARRIASPEWRAAAHFQRGAAHPRYKGNKASRQREVGRYEYKKWHKLVLEKDNFTCQVCDKRGGRLQAHHIKPWADHVELRYDIANGQALCEPCHDTVHNRTHRKPPSRICEHCGIRFKLNKSRQRFCSISCAALARYHK